MGSVRGSGEVRVLEALVGARPRRGSLRIDWTKARERRAAIAVQSIRQRRPLTCDGGSWRPMTAKLDLVSQVFAPPETKQIFATPAQVDNAHPKYDTGPIFF